MSAPTTQGVTFDQISDFGDLIPAGHEFSGRAKKIEAKTTKQKEDGSGGDKPFLALSFEVLEGEFEGLEFSKFYFLNITKSQKNGRLYGKGVLELCSDMKAIGKPLPDSYRFEMNPALKDVQALAKIVAERIKPAVTPRIKFKSVSEVIQRKNEATQKWEDALNDDGSKQTRAKYIVIGAGASAQQHLDVEQAQGEPQGEQQQEGPLGLL